MSNNNFNEVELDVDPEHIMWLYHIKFFIELKRKYDTYIKFRGHRAYLEGSDLSRVRLGQEEVKRKARQEFVYDFLMQSNNPEESYMPYMDLLSNQEYERMKKQYNGLYIFTRKQFMTIKQELSEKFGYIINFSRQYPVAFVLIFLPQSKQSFLLQRIGELVEVINKSLHQNVTPMNAQYFSYRNRDLATRNVFHKKYQIKLTELQAIQIFIVFDIRKIEEHFQISISLSSYEQFVILILQGQSDQSCQQAAIILENHLKNKTLFQITYEQRALLQDKQIIEIEEIESTANRLDQLFATDILRRITSMLGKCCFIFTVQEEVQYLKSKLMSEYHSSKFTSSNMASEVEVKKQQPTKQIKVVKDHKIETKGDYLVVEFFNYKEGQNFYLFQNNFNEEEFQRDFDKFCKLKIEPDYSVQNQLKFRVLYQDPEQRQKAIDFLDNYMNYKVNYVLRYQVDLQVLEEVAEDFNCKLSGYTCFAAPGWNEDDIPRSENGKDFVLVFTNLMHCFIEQLKQKVQSIVQRNQIVALLFESQISFISKQAQIKKLEIFAHFYLEDCYWVLIEAKDPKSIIQLIANEDEQLLNKALKNLPVKQSDSIVLSNSAVDKDFYDVFLPELYQRYYSKMRKDYLQHCMSEEQWRNCKLVCDEKLFCVEITDLNIPPFSLEPIIVEIAEFQKQGRVIEKLTDLQKGLYLIGRARGIDKDVFTLLQNNHLISSIVNIKE